MKRIVSSVLLLAGALGMRSIGLNRRSKGMQVNVQQTNKESISPIPASIFSCVQDGVMQITFNRPTVLNAIDLDMVETLRQLLMAARTDQTIRAIVITGKGRAFCAGGDLKFAVQANPAHPWQFFCTINSRTAHLH